MASLLLRFFITAAHVITVQGLTKMSMCMNNNVGDEQFDIFKRSGEDFVKCSCYFNSKLDVVVEVQYRFETEDLFCIKSNSSLTSQKQDCVTNGTSHGGIQTFRYRNSDINLFYERSGSTVGNGNANITVTSLNKTEIIVKCTGQSRIIVSTVDTASVHMTYTRITGITTTKRTTTERDVRKFDILDRQTILALAVLAPSVVLSFIAAGTFLYYQRGRTVNVASQSVVHRAPDNVTWSPPSRIEPDAPPLPDPEPGLRHEGPGMMPKSQEKMAPDDVLLKERPPPYVP